MGVALVGKAAKMYRVEVRSSAERTFTVKSKDYEMLVGIKGKGMTPPDTLLASLATCIGVYIRKYAEGAKLDLEGFSISAEAEFTKEPPYLFTQIAVNIEFDKPILDEKRQKALLDFVHNCPVRNTLSANPKIDVKII